MTSTDHPSGAQADRGDDGPMHAVGAVDRR
jgi:hypothetical protein